MPRKPPEKYVKQFILKVNGVVIDVDPEGNFKKHPLMIQMEEALSRRLSKLINPVDLPSLFRNLEREDEG